MDDSNRSVYLVCYDIAEPRRLARVRRACLGFGSPVQRSVFRCVLSPKELAELRERLRAEMNEWEDRALFADLGAAEGRGAAAVSTLGEAVEGGKRGAVVI